MLEKEKLLNWLTELALVQKKRNDLVHFDTSDNPENELHTLDTYSDIHLSEISTICDVLGIVPQKRDWEHRGRTAKHISFEYEGILFFSLENYIHSNAT